MRTIFRKYTNIKKMYFGVLVGISMLTLDKICARGHRHHGQPRVERMRDFSDDTMLLAPREFERNRFQAIDIHAGTGFTCQCTGRKGNWERWSQCLPRGSGCYEAQQTRIRTCQSDCSRIQIRNCLDAATCSGTWGEWIRNSSCGECDKTGMTYVKFCSDKKGTIGSYCADGNGRSYKVKYVPCDEACANARTANPGSLLDNSESQGWIASSTGNLIVILLAVLAGVLLIALIFVSVLFTSFKNRSALRKRGARSRRSASESNVSATSILSRMERESKVSGRVPVFQQKNKGAMRRPVVLSNNVTEPPTEIEGSSSITVRSPMQHTDSLMLARKQIRSKPTKTGSLRSINKLLRGRDSASPTINANSPCENSQKEYGASDGDSTLKRRATDGAYDRRKKQQQYFTNHQNDYGSTKMTLITEMRNIGGNDVESISSKRAEYNESASSSEEEQHLKVTKRGSVEDMKRMFENVSSASMSLRSGEAADIPTKIKTVRESETRREKIPGKREKKQRKAMKFLESFKKKRNATVPPFESVTDEGKKDVSDSLIAVLRASESRSGNKTADQTIGTASRSPQDIGKHKSKTFLFSPQAYNSLQRSGNNKGVTTGINSGTEFKLNHDALIRKAAASQSAKNEGREKPKVAETTQNDRSRSFEDLSGKEFTIPAPSIGLSMFDSDVYADVWDAKIKQNDANSAESIYADVWDSDVASRSSIRLNNDDDYSEVFDATTNKNNVVKARRFATTRNIVSLGTVNVQMRPASLTEKIQYLNKYPTLRSTSSDPSPAHPNLLTHRERLRIFPDGQGSRSDQDDLNGSELLHSQVTEQITSAVQNDPTYAVI